VGTNQDSRHTFGECEVMKLHMRICVTGGSLSEWAKDELIIHLNTDAILWLKTFANIELEEVDSTFIRLHELNRLDSQSSTQTANQEEQ
jgi:hypothetical protein